MEPQTGIALLPLLAERCHWQPWQGEFIGFIRCHRHSRSVEELSTALQHPQGQAVFWLHLTVLKRYLRRHLGKKNVSPRLKIHYVNRQCMGLQQDMLSLKVFFCFVLFFFYRRWSTGSMLSERPGSTTYRWPSPERVTRRWGRLM